MIIRRGAPEPELIGRGPENVEQDSYSFYYLPDFSEDSNDQNQTVALYSEVRIPLTCRLAFNGSIESLIYHAETPLLESVSPIRLECRGEILNPRGVTYQRSTLGPLSDIISLGAALENEIVSRGGIRLDEHRPLEPKANILIPKTYSGDVPSILNIGRVSLIETIEMSSQGKTIHKIVRNLKLGEKE